MALAFQAPTEGYEDAIVVPVITADNFELKHGLLTLVQNKPFCGLDKEDLPAHSDISKRSTSIHCLAIIESKSKVRYSQSKEIVAKVGTSSSTPGVSPDVAELKDMEKLNLPNLTKTRMILELADRTISTPTGIAEDVFVKVGTFLFPADFLVIDYIADPRVPLILRRPFLRTARALIDVHGEQMTLRHDDQSITFKVGNTKTFSYNTIESVNRVDVIDVACEEFAQKKLGIIETIFQESIPPQI
ncbi:reverse transcriptase domain-containing protein [Tanacetum coccineum]